MVNSILPSSATVLECAVEKHMEGKFIALPSDILADLYNPLKIPAHLLPYLAAHLSVDIWNPAWREQDKRKVIAGAVEVHQKKGTLHALKKALDGLGIVTELEQWYDYEGRPYRFRIHLMHEATSQNDYNTILATIAEAKNLRSWLDKIIAHFEVEGAIYTGGAPCMHHHIYLYPVAAKTKESYGQIYGGGGSLVNERIYIQPITPKDYNLTMRSFMGGAIKITENIYVN